MTFEDSDESKISFGMFKTMNLNKTLFRNIPHIKTTPIQRKIIPLLLDRINVTGIARTGSGKTFAYLVPIINNILNQGESNEKNKDSQENGIFNLKLLVIVPTRELAIQVFKVANLLSKKTDLKVLSIFGGVSIDKDFSNISEKGTDICIATVGRLRHCLEEMKLKIKTDFLVIDEVDRIYEEASMKNDLEQLIDEDIRISYTNISLFSATLPEKVIPLVNQTRLIKIDTEMSESLKNFFFFVNKDDKEKSLMVLLDRINKKEKTQSKKIIIFASTRHTIELLSDILSKSSVKHKILYSSLDQQARTHNLNAFSTGKVSVIVTTDLAARGLDIKNLDICINYDMTDEKTFLHRVGRVARSGRNGESFSFVTLFELNHFYNLSDTYENRKEEFKLGTIPQELIDYKKIEIDEVLKKSAENGEKKMESFRKKMRKTRKRQNISELKEHEYFLDEIFDKKLLEKEMKKQDLLSMIKNYKGANNLKKNEEAGEKNESKNKEMEKEYKDQFYIPYSNKGNKGSLHYSAHTIPKDEETVNEKERKKKEIGLLFKEWEKKKRRMGNKGTDAKNKIDEKENGSKKFKPNINNKKKLKR